MKNETILCYFNSMILSVRLHGISFPWPLNQARRRRLRPVAGRGGFSEWATMQCQQPPWDPGL